MNDAPVTRPDLDARLHEIAERGDAYKDEDGGFLIDHEDAETVREAAAALAAERARADRAEQRIADALKLLADHMPRYGMELRPDGSEDPLAAAYVEGYGTAYQPVHAILSAAPVATQ